MTYIYNLKFEMGNKSSGTLGNAYNPSLEGWMLAKRGEDFNIWRNTGSD